MDIVDITKEIYESGKRLEKGSKELFSLATNMAKSEQKYRKALSLEIMRLKNEKMAISIINDVAKGNVSDLKYERDVAELMYKSAINSLEAIKAQANGLQSILKIQKDI